MALSTTILAGLIQTNLQNMGANGSNLSTFCNAVAAGIVLSIVGQTFNTVDVGMITNPGIGTGTGITGLSASTMSSMAVTALTSQGSNASNLMDAISMAVVSHLSTDADLSLTDPLVFTGTGTIEVSTFSLIVSAMSDNISAQLTMAGANGANVSKLANAIATGVVNEIQASGTGTLTITGVPPTFPVPGGNFGTGTIS